jgi:predicted lipoprotein with Yx(FWY)xxD motif
MRGKWWAPAGFAAAALVLAACGSSSSSNSASSGSASSSTPSAASSAASAMVIKTTRVNGKKVLTNAQGMVLYWFVPDTSTKSNCSSQCLKYWPLVQGPATAGTGVTGTLSVITTNGVKQVVYDGHPLYTYVGDTSPGMDKGNGLNASGGLWWAVTPAGGKLKAATTGTGSSSGGSSGGYGY